MGIEKGSVIIWDKKYWLFARHSVDEKMNATYVLHGMNGEIIEPLEEECTFLIAPSEMRL